MKGFTFVELLIVIATIAIIAAIAVPAFHRYTQETKPKLNPEGADVCVTSLNLAQVYATAGWELLPKIDDRLCFKQP